MKARIQAPAKSSTVSRAVQPRSPSRETRLHSTHCKRFVQAATRSGILARAGSPLGFDQSFVRVDANHLIDHRAAPKNRADGRSFIEI